MPNQSPLPTPALTTEDLLRLKRFEKPAPEFWTSFDRELNARILQRAISHPPRRRWPKFFLFIALPASGMAALVLTWVLLPTTSELPVLAQAEPPPPVAVPVSQHPVAVAAPIPAAVETEAYQNHPVHFVTDDFRPPESQRFQKVMSTETYRANHRSGAVYVVDSLAPFAKSSTVATGMTHF